MKINIVYVTTMMLGLVVFTNVATAQDLPSDREKAHIVSSIYQITYGSDEICKRFAPDQAEQVSEAVNRFKRTYPELIQLVEQSPYLDQAKKLSQATIGMVAKSASKDPKSAGCQESLWILKQSVEAKGGKQAIEEMISELKK